MLAVTHSVSDLHTKNISFELSTLDSWNDAQIREYLGEPSMNMVFRRDDQPLGPEVPPYTVEPAYVWSPIEESLTRRIKIIDFGEASFSKEARKELHTPIMLRAPESFFGGVIGLPADIWALACAVFDIFGKHSLFEAFMPDNDSALFEMISTLGMLPDRWWREWETRFRYFRGDGRLRTEDIVEYYHKPRRLAQRIQQMRLPYGGQQAKTSEQLSATDTTKLQNLLSLMLRYEPSKRITAEEIVKLEWVQQLLQESS